MTAPKPWAERVGEMTVFISKTNGTHYPGHRDPMWCLDTARAVCAYFDALTQSQEDCNASHGERRG